MIPKHPVTERGAAVFHGLTALIGLAHIVLGGAMLWYHLTGALRHWSDREP